MIAGLGKGQIAPIEIIKPEKKSGPIITDQMIDQWNQTTQITNSLQVSIKEKFEKVETRVSHLEKKSSDYALKTDLEKT